jgi:Fe-S cluster assembly protein SufD
MNMHSAPKLTPAETSLIEGFAARVSQLPGSPEVLQCRDAAIEQVKAGLPTRRVEAWHYTDLRRLLTNAPSFEGRPAPSLIEPLVGGSLVLRLQNGHAEATSSGLDGLTLARVEDKLRDGSLAPALMAHSSDDAVGAVNGAFVTDGWFLDIADSAVIAAPIELQNLHSGGQAHVRNPVRVGKGAKVTLIERQTGEDAGLVSAVSHLTVGDGAEVTWIIVQEQPADATHLGQFNASIGKDAKLTVFIMNAGGKLVRQEVRVVQEGEGSEFRLRGINLLADDTHCDVTMVLDHLAPHTTSTEVIRNVATGRARGVFQGQIRVDREAQKTDAKMACNTLLLSDDAEFSAKPELEIFADDVACGHGATVTEIDAAHLFYLMARGVDEKSARGLLIKAFVAEVVEELENETLVEALEGKLDDWFATHA